VNIFSRINHKQTAKFYFIKFEEKVYEICFLFQRVSKKKIKIPSKKTQQLPLHKGI